MIGEHSERIGAAFELGEYLTVMGDPLKPGDVAPAFSLEAFDAETGTIRMVSLEDSAGAVRLLNVINSLDTPVCHRETQRWEAIRQDLPEHVVVYTVSMDLPFAQARWMAAESAGHLALSAHKDELFGVAYGVLLKEWRLLQRAVFVIDANDMITYADYVADQMHEPAYEPAVAAVDAAMASLG